MLANGRLENRTNTLPLVASSLFKAIRESLSAEIKANVFTLQNEGIQYEFINKELCHIQDNLELETLNI